MNGRLSAPAPLHGVVWLLAGLLVGAQPFSPSRANETAMPEKTIEAALKEYTDRLMSLPGVVGTAQSECAGKPCIKVYVSKKTPELLGQIPSDIEGFPVEVEETGEIRARDLD